MSQSVTKILKGADAMICPKCYGPVVKQGFDNNGNQRYNCKECGHRPTHPIVDEEILIENVRSRKQVQKHMDTNRIERKSFREHARIENAYAEYTKELIQRLDDNKFHELSEIKHVDGTGAGVIHLSDIHFNELVNLPHNQYSFEVAAKRLKRLANEAYFAFGFRGISNVLIAFTGDLMNSDRRMDELLSNATNRSKATFLAVDILSQFIGEISQSFNVTVASVTGNEGRVDKEPGWIDALATHNYDYTIHGMLAQRFIDTSVKFILGDPLEQVIEVAGKHFLLMHGHSIGSKSNLSDYVTKIIGKYAGRGIRIDYVIFGHIHEADIGDIYARSGSTVGANAYSENGLNLLSRPSQNLYTVDSYGNINGYKIDLSYTGEQTYQLDSELASYNSKSASKLHEPVVIHSIVI
jgi:predicted phosphodiesterase